MRSEPNSIENRHEHTYRMAHVRVPGHGWADTTDWEMSRALAAAVLR